MVEAAASCSAPARKAPKIEKKEATPEQKALKEAIAARTSSLATLKRAFKKHRKDLNEHLDHVIMKSTGHGIPDAMNNAFQGEYQKMNLQLLRRVCEHRNVPVKNEYFQRDLALFLELFAVNKGEDKTPTSKQMTFMADLERRHSIVAPASAWRSKSNASLWIEANVKKNS